MAHPVQLVVFPVARPGFHYSPFCMKLETYCRLTKTPYELKEIMTPKTSPKGKLPYLIDGVEKIGDSTLSVSYLRMKFNHSIDDWLNQEQHAVGLAVQRMLEEHLYFAMLYSRWIDEGVWPKIKEIFFSELPGVAKRILPELIRKGFKKSLIKQGIGRHSDEEIYTFAKEDLMSLAAIIGEHKFLLGDQVSSYDAIVFSFLANLLQVDFGTEIEREAKNYEVFSRYLKSVESLF